MQPNDWDAYDKEGPFLYLPCWLVGWAEIYIEYAAKTNCYFISIEIVNNKINVDLKHASLIRKALCSAEQWLAEIEQAIENNEADQMRTKLRNHYETSLKVDHENPNNQ
jgi:hypothetical protein